MGGVSGMRNEMGRVRGPVDEWRVDGRSLHVAACVTGGTRVTVRPSLYVSFPFSHHPPFTPFPSRIVRFRTFTSQYAPQAGVTGGNATRRERRERSGK